MSLSWDLPLLRVPPHEINATRQLGEAKMTRLYAGVAAAAVAALLGGSFLYIQKQRAGDAFADCRTGVAGGDIGGPFTLAVPERDVGLERLHRS